MTNSIDRSYLVDSIATQQSDIGNSIFSALTSAGACMGALIASLDWEGIFKLSTGGQTKVVFATIIIVLFVCISLTLCSVKEPHIGKDGKVQQNSDNSKWTKYYICCNYFAFDLYKRLSISGVEYELQQIEDYEMSNVALIQDNEDINSITEYTSENEEQTDEQSTICQNIIEESKLTSMQDSLPSEISSVNEQRELEEHLFTEQTSDDLTTLIPKTASQESITMSITDDTVNQRVTDMLTGKAVWIFNIPKALYNRVLGAVNFVKSLSGATVWLWITHLLGWVTELSLNIFVTNYVGSVVYNGSADADPSSESFRNYAKGIRMGFACQSIEYGSSFIFSLLFKRIISIIRLRELSISIHVLTFISSGLLVAFHSIYWVGFLYIIFGWYSAIIQIIPFTIIQQYKVLKCYSCYCFV